MAAKAEETNLKRIRQKKGLSQKQLAVISGVTLRSIQCYEQRDRDIDGAHLSALCDLCLALDCKIEDIIESKDLLVKFKMVK